MRRSSMTGQSEHLLLCLGDYRQISMRDGRHRKEQRRNKRLIEALGFERRQYITAQGYTYIHLPSRLSLMFLLGRVRLGYNNTIGGS
jgi:hypothetical protein